MKDYEKPSFEKVKLLVQEDIALTRTNIDGIGSTYTGKPVTTYKTTEDAVVSTSHAVSGDFDDTETAE